MVNPTKRHTKLSELILAALNEAARRSDDPQIVVELATLDVIETLRRRKTADSKANDAHMLAVPSGSKKNEGPAR